MSLFAGKSLFPFLPRPLATAQRGAHNPPMNTDPKGTDMDTTTAADYTAADAAAYFAAQDAAKAHISAARRFVVCARLRERALNKADDYSRTMRDDAAAEYRAAGDIYRQHGCYGDASRAYNNAAWVRVVRV